MQKLAYLFVFLIVVSCTPKTAELKTGIWRGVLEIQGEQLPFNFEVKTDTKGGINLVLQNADERLLLDEVSFVGDSLNIVLHVFDAYLRAVIKDDSLIGLFNLDTIQPIRFRSKLSLVKTSGLLLRNRIRLPKTLPANMKYNFLMRKILRVPLL